MTDTPAAEKAQAAASTASDESLHVAGVAQQEASRVAGEATAQVRSLAGEAHTQVSDQAADQTRQQRDKLVGTLTTLGNDLDQMADRSDGGLAADVTREVAVHTKSLTSYLDGREPGDLLDDVRDFARRRPGTFLVGALAAGLVAGRLARGVKDADSAPSAGSAPDAVTPPSNPMQTHAAPPPPMTSPMTPPMTSGPDYPAPTGDPLPSFPAPPPAYPPGGLGAQPGTPA